MNEVTIERGNLSLFAHREVAGGPEFVIHISSDGEYAMAILTPDEAKTLAKFLSPDMRAGD